ncbi:hypothetical protein QQX09_00540 [Demequina sp. SYSU T00192]|uniref:Uncharacterized protein n=1 Tax=Demequina litoralis TaxID=3051660 RepID=A0ABT8G6J8_9MICO|nr:hypothetical protein [Demequina sp. SYSU T00192]MDN4474334.1 hypothetical protein [Demequina sp. SYSU T00192]
MPIRAVMMQSEPWVERLRESVAALDDVLSGQRDDGAEMDVMFGAFCARRLGEIDAVPRSVTEAAIPVVGFPLPEGSPEPRTSYVLDYNPLTYYYAGAGTPTEVKAWDLLNWLMHSAYYFDIRTGAEDEPGRITGAAFASDRSRHDRLLHVELTQIVTLFSAVADAAKGTREELLRAARTMPHV